MIISPTFVLCAIYLICKIIQLSAILVWYLLVALWWLASWPFKTAAAEYRWQTQTSDTKLGASSGVSNLTSRSIRTSPDIDIDMAQKAKKGSARDTVGIFVHIDAQLHRAYLEAVAERDITTRRLVEAALRRELADPTAMATQGGLYDVA